MVEWAKDGSICPACKGPGRNSPSYPAAICRFCEDRLVDWAGRPARTANTSTFGTGVYVSTDAGIIADGDVPIFVDGIPCWAREVRWGGVAVQPVAALIDPNYLRTFKNKTLSDFGFSGRAVLDFLIKASSWGSIDQAIASLSIFAHPDVVTASGSRAIFRTKRDLSRRNQVIDGVLCDDNHSPAMAFEWSTGFKRPIRSDLICCHLYTASGDPEAYTDIRNIFYVPNFIAKLTDSQAATLPSEHALKVLRYRAFVIYGYCGPKSSTPPARPDHFDKLEWAHPVGAGTDAEDLQRRLRARLAKRPDDRVAKSVAQCGWAFSDYKPDPAVIYTGS